MEEEKVSADTNLVCTMNPDENIVAIRASSSGIMWSSAKTKTENLTTKTSSAQSANRSVKQIGREIYEKQFAHLLETEENSGKFFALDIHSNDYEINEDLVILTEIMVERHPNTEFYLRRIGLDYIAKFL